jgi:hypothetical protein
VVKARVIYVTLLTDPYSSGLRSIVLYNFKEKPLNLAPYVIIKILKNLHTFRSGGILMMQLSDLSRFRSSIPNCVIALSAWNLVQTQAIKEFTFRVHKERLGMFKHYQF